MVCMPPYTLMFERPWAFIPPEHISEATNAGMLHSDDPDPNDPNKFLIDRIGEVDVHAILKQAMDGIAFIQGCMLVPKWLGKKIESLHRNLYDLSSIYYYHAMAHPDLRKAMIKYMPEITGEDLKKIPGFLIQFANPPPGLYDLDYLRHLASVISGPVYARRVKRKALLLRAEQEKNNGASNHGEGAVGATAGPKEG